MDENTTQIKQGLSSLKRKLKNTPSGCKNDSPTEEVIEARELPEMKESGNDLTDVVNSVQKDMLIWKCNDCNHECIPIRRESRCLCGHRMKEHKAIGDNPYKCSARGCACSQFFFVVAEGAWVLKCRCKHKHVDHHPNESYTCRKCASCTGFDSPWVCNCGHAWSQHSQIVVTRGAGDAQLQDVFTSAGKAFAVRQDGLLKGEF